MSQLPTMALRMSASSYDQWMTCPRLFYFTQVLRIERVKEEGAAAFGKLYHSGLEAWWLAMDGGDMPWRHQDVGLVAASKAINDAASHLDTDPYDVAKAEAMLTAYHARYFELDFVTPVGGGVEVPFDLPLRDEHGREVGEWRVVGRQDAIKRFSRIGRTRPVEHKTSGQEIHNGAPYWDRVALDTQVSIYVDAAQQLGHDTSEAMYDVSRKPDIRPYKQTPDEKRRFTKGKGCAVCGGRKGGKGGAAKGSGRLMVLLTKDGDGRPLAKPTESEIPCETCGGTGWFEAPKLDKRQHLEDEPVPDYKTRVAEELADDFDAHFRMVVITRTELQLAETRANLATTAGLIESMLTLAAQRSHGHLGMPEARRMFPQNTRACLSIYGAVCPFILVCKGAVNPAESKLYRLKTKREVPR